MIFTVKEFYFSKIIAKVFKRNSAATKVPAVKSIAYSTKQALTGGGEVTFRKEDRTSIIV